MDLKVTTDGRRAPHGGEDRAREAVPSLTTRTDARSAADCGERRQAAGAFARARLAFRTARAPSHSVTERRFSPSDNPLCPRSQIPSYSSSIVPGGGKAFGDDDGRAPNRICRGDCNRLFRVPADLNQSTANPAME